MISLLPLFSFLRKKGYYSRDVTTQHPYGHE